MKALRFILESIALFFHKELEKYMRMPILINRRLYD